MSELIAKAKPYQRWLLLIPMVLSGWWFYLLEENITMPEYLLHVRLDDYIPFVPHFVIPYILWFLYVAIPAVFLFFKAPREFSKMAIFLSSSMIIACTVFALFPNGQALRPILRGYEQPLIRLIRYIYLTDTPINSAPSIHVIFSVATHAAIVSYNNHRRRIGWVNTASFILAGACSLSTIFIKQHSVIDIIAGFLLSGILYFLIYGIQKTKSRQLVQW